MCEEDPAAGKEGKEEWGLSQEPHHVLNCFPHPVKQRKHPVISQGGHLYTWNQEQTKHLSILRGKVRGTAHVPMLTTTKKKGNCE